MKCNIRFIIYGSIGTNFIFICFTSSYTLLTNLSHDFTLSSVYVICINCIISRRISALKNRLIMKLFGKWIIITPKKIFNRYILWKSTKNNLNNHIPYVENQFLSCWSIKKSIKFIDIIIFIIHQCSRDHNTIPKTIIRK